VVSVFSNSSWLLRNLKKVSKMKLLSSFQLATHFCSNDALSIFVSIVRKGVGRKFFRGRWATEKDQKLAKKAKK